MNYNVNNYNDFLRILISDNQLVNKANYLLRDFLRALTARTFANQIFDSFIEEDNFHIKMRIKKLKTIYSRNLRILILTKFLRWKLNSRKKVKSHNVSKRLYNDYKAKQNYLQLLKMIYHYKESEDCTFEPKTNKKTLLNYFLHNSSAKTKNDKSNYTNKTKNPSSISSNYSSQSYIREKPISIQNPQKRIISLKKKTSSIANIAYYKKNEKNYFDYRQSIPHRKSTSFNTSNTSTSKPKYEKNKISLSLTSSYPQVTHVTLQSTSDAKMLDMANNLIPTDESLANFEHCLKKKKNKK